MRNFHSNNIKQKPYSIKFSQNFIKQPGTAKESVTLMDIQPNDLVIEVGPGKAMLTQFILQRTNNLIVVEQDSALANKLKDDIRLKVINQDFLKYQLPDKGNYKVVGNIPFALTTKIIKKLMDSPNIPQQISFIMQREAGLRIIGGDHKINYENSYSLRYKPWYQSEIVKHYSKNDFEPRPGVEIVLLNMIRREESIIKDEEKDQYFDFITYCFASWKPNIKAVLKDIFTYKQMEIIGKQSKINFSWELGKVGFEDWMVLFDSFIKYVPAEKKEIVKGFYQRKSMQEDLEGKVHRSWKTYTK